MRARLAHALRRVADRLMPAHPPAVQVEIDGAAIMNAINRYRRQRGEPGL